MRKLGVAAALFSSLHLGGAADISKLIGEGTRLSQPDATRLEDQLLRKPDRSDDRVRLVAFWTHRPQDINREEIIERRANHILWLIENTPKNSLFQTNESRIYLSGVFADKASFDKGKSLWEQALRGSHDDREIRENAAEWLRLGDPESAAAIFDVTGNSRTKGYFYGEAILGITARDFETGNPVECSEQMRGSPLAQKALGLIQQSQDAAFVSGATFAFGWQAGVLYADGKLEWDYTPLLKTFISKARQLDPTNLESYGISTELPPRGQRPPGVLRIGGTVMQKKLIAQSQVPPTYPVSARNNGVQGTARLNVLIGLNGGIVKMAAVSGPPELVQAAAQAVRNWRYEPTLLNGKPCFVLTTVEVHFTLN